MQLIPAIDLRRGRVVRLAQGDDDRRKTYDHDPADLLARFADAGVSRVHVVDLDAAFGEEPQRALVESLVAATDLNVELGGGLRDASAVAWALGAGCERLVLGSVVARDFPAFEALVARHPGRLVPAVEVAGGELKVAGWRESAALTLEDLCRRLQGLPCPAALVTDVERDGTLQGPNLDLARHVAEVSGIPSIVSGGVHSLGDLEAAAGIPGIGAVIVGKALYEERFTLADALEAAEGPRRTTP
ncbi:MAG: 1-(5-phosphoribosyl)-5-[(5-phosphoribosylamino)methylideneamino] imidazole-4-carboxamide isomerase [Acidobacteriota bacterium]